MRGAWSLPTTSILCVVAIHAGCGANEQTTDDGAVSRSTAEAFSPYPKCDRTARELSVMRLEDPSRGEIISLIDELMDEIRRPFDEADMQHGWSAANRPAALKMLERVRIRLLDPRPLSADEIRPSLARDFDAIGIDGGCLLDRVAIVGNALNRLVGRR